MGPSSLHATMLSPKLELPVKAGDQCQRRNEARQVLTCSPSFSKQPISLKPCHEYVWLFSESALEAAETPSRPRGSQREFR